MMTRRSGNRDGRNVENDVPSEEPAEPRKRRKNNKRRAARQILTVTTRRAPHPSPNGERDVIADEVATETDQHKTIRMRKAKVAETHRVRPPARPITHRQYGTTETKTGTMEVRRGVAEAEVADEASDEAGADADAGGDEGEAVAEEEAEE